MYGRAGINRRASEMVDTWVRLPSTEDSAELEVILKRRDSVSGYLGLSSSLREGLATTVLAALPLLSALLSSLVGATVTFWVHRPT